MNLTRKFSKLIFKGKRGLKKRLSIGKIGRSPAARKFRRVGLKKAHLGAPLKRRRKW